MPTANAPMGWPKELLLTPIAICVPVRDEAAELPNLFAALDRLERHRIGVLTICLLLDGCIDESASVADAYRARSPSPILIGEVARSSANAGRARHRAMMLGLEALGDNGGFLLTTDADSMPAPCWVPAMASALEIADVVPGKIVRTGQRPHALQDRVEAYYDALFALRRALDPVPWEAANTHHQSGGANMGVRTAAYRMIGGFAAVASGEDAQFVDDASRAGLRVRRDAASLVHTSDRRTGRAIGGLAQALRHGDAGDAAAIHVAHPADAAWQYRMQATARAAHGQDRLDLVATSLGITRDHVHGVARDCPNAEAFAMRIVPVPPAGMRRVALPLAEAELHALVATREAA